MKKVLYFVVLGLFVCALAGISHAGNTPDEAKAMVKKAVAYVKENGKEKAFAEFNNPKGQFVEGELYIFVIDFNGKMLAHGSNQSLVGKDMIETKDPDGVYLFKEFIKTAKQGGGWVDYKWPHPATKKVEPKTSYVEALDDLILGCGVYK